MAKKKQNEIVESLAAAAARLGVDLHVVQKAKRAGCAAFRPGNRVHVGELKQYFDANPPPNAPTLPPLSQSELEELSTIEASRQAAIRDEIETGRLLQRARETGDNGAVPDLTLAVGRARKNRMAAETAVTQLQVTRGQLLSLDAHKMQLFKLWPPIMNAIRQIPRKAATALHPDVDQIRVEKVVSEFVEAAIATARAITLPSSEEEKRWAASQLLMVISAENGKLCAGSLELVDSLRTFVVAELAKNPSPAAKGQPSDF